MRHCIVVMFEDTKMPAYFTNWLNEADAVAQVKKDLAQCRAYPAWICWSYFFRHLVDDKLIIDQLKELAQEIINNFGDTVVKRSMFRGLRDYVPILGGAVQVYHLKGDMKKGYGFAYAQCTRRGIPTGSSPS